MNNKLRPSFWALNLSAATLWDWFVAPPRHQHPRRQDSTRCSVLWCCGMWLVVGGDWGSTLCPPLTSPTLLAIWPADPLTSCTPCHAVQHENKNTLPQVWPVSRPPVSAKLLPHSHRKAPVTPIGWLVCLHLLRAWDWWRKFIVKVGLKFHVHSRIYQNCFSRSL